MTYLAVYQDKIFDLLNPEDKDIRVKNQGDLGDYLENAAELNVSSTDDLLRLFHQGAVYHVTEHVTIPITLPPRCSISCDRTCDSTYNSSGF